MGEDNVIHVDVSPRAVVVIDDLQRGRLSGKLADVPDRGFEPFPILSGGFANLATFHAEDDPGLLRRNATTQEEPDMGVCDLERR